MAKIVNLCIFASVLFGCTGAQQEDDKLSIYTKDQEITILDHSSHQIYFYTRGSLVNGTARLVSGHGDVVKISPDTIDLSSSPPWNVTITGLQRGHDTVYINATNVTEFDASDAFVVVTVARNLDMVTVSNVVGWLYFLAWSVSFYPQCWINFRRKSVVGLNFDYIFLNVIGFMLYSLFNCGLYWSKEIEAEYFAAHPRGLNPVLLNDVFFGLHAVAITSVTITQCFFYERGGQRVSKIATGIICVIATIFVVSLILPFFSVINWLNFLYICSYVKLAITLMKYVPQAVMNYRRKSTIGWSIGNVILDFTGGMLSMMQMIINADNYDDWMSIFGDPTKFGLGLFSVCFDIVFMIQHYILYRNQSYEELPGGVYDSEPPTDVAPTPEPPTDDSPSNEPDEQQQQQPSTLPDLLDLPVDT